MPLNLKELSTVFHFPYGIISSQLKQAKAGIAPAPVEMSEEGIILGINNYRGRETMVHMSQEDRVRHMYVIGQTGTGKTSILKNMIVQDIRNGDGVCFIDPHGVEYTTNSADKIDGFLDFVDDLDKLGSKKLERVDLYYFNEQQPSREIKEEYRRYWTNDFARIFV